MKKKQVITILLPCLLVLMLLSVSIFRSWIRSSLVLAYSQFIFGSKTSKIFDGELKQINNKFNSYGFQLIDKKSLPYEDRDGLNSWEPFNGCKLVGYEGIHETIYCQKVDEFKPQVFSEEFKKLWIEKSPEFASFLENLGWEKEYSDQPDYTELFNSHLGNWLGYTKNHGKVNCKLTVAYNPPYPNPDDQVWIHEICRRDVKFFGGY